MARNTFRDRLRGLSVGQSLTCLCKDGYELHSRRTNAYQLAKCEGITLQCLMSDGWALDITRKA